MENKDKDFEELEEQLAFAEDKVCSLEQMIKELTAKHEAEMLKAKEELQNIYSAAGIKYTHTADEYQRLYEPPTPAGTAGTPEQTGRYTTNINPYTGVVTEDLYTVAVPRPYYGVDGTTGPTWNEPVPVPNHWVGEVAFEQAGLPYPVPQPDFARPDGAPHVPPTPMLNRLEELERRLMGRQDRMMYETQPFNPAPGLVELEQTVADNQAAFQNDLLLDINTLVELTEGEND